MALFLWKTIRTDWVAIVPWYNPPGSWGGSGSFNLTYYPPVSPAWNPPKPEYGSWSSNIEGKGARGSSHLRPTYGVMAIKILGAYLFFWVIIREYDSCDLEA